LKEPELSMWVEKSASKYGARLSPEVIKELIELIGSNLWVMDSELQKLSLYSDDGKVTMSHVDELVSYSRENNIFQLIDAILFRRLKKAQQLLRQLMNGGAESVYILFMLTREIRRMLLAKLASSGKILPVELARELKLLESNDLRIAAAKSRRYAMATLSEFYHRILKTDINIKTGKLSSQFALELLIAEICSESPSG
ncbi:MAG: DNA polymerase III subunit delta, partial [Dehalococcoidia bacterium]|nr:DNA polymerase III subunit delta [Dehalococcoidia bacterium]